MIPLCREGTAEKEEPPGKRDLVGRDGADGKKCMLLPSASDRGMAGEGYQPDEGSG
ncbi:MAG: hypothetical protein LUQ44_01045 [Methanothrix sp.]|nr:hypothetical protein [Methanothrix sp.]